MMPEIVGSALAERILSASAFEVSALKFSTSMPISSPYLILRLTYFKITGLSESRKINNFGVDFKLRTSWAWRSLMKLASSEPLRIFMSGLRRG